MATDALAPYLARTSAAMIFDYVEYVGPVLTWGRILSTCVKIMWSNDTKCKYMFMFPLKNLARKGLRNTVKVNPSVAETGIIEENLVHIMHTNALAPFVARSWAPMVFTMEYTCISMG